MDHEDLLNISSKIVGRSRQGPLTDPKSPLTINHFFFFFCLNIICGQSKPVRLDLNNVNVGYSTATSVHLALWVIHESLPVYVDGSTFHPTDQLFGWQTRPGSWTKCFELGLNHLVGLSSTIIDNSMALFNLKHSPFDPVRDQEFWPFHHFKNIYFLIFIYFLYFLFTM